MLSIRSNNLLFVVPLFIGSLFLVGGLVFAFKDSLPLLTAPTPTPTPVATLAPTIAPTPTPTPDVEEEASPSADLAEEREEVSVIIQNGTTISGQAGKVQDALKALGYTDVSTGNASTKAATITTLSLKDTVTKALEKEIQGVLGKLFKEVEVTEASSSAKADMVIVTGTPL